MEETVLRLLVAPKLQIIGFLVMVENLNLGFIPSPCYRHYNLCVNGMIVSLSPLLFPSGKVELVNKEPDEHLIELN
jgi:hypothetical protein